MALDFHTGFDVNPHRLADPYLLQQGWSFATGGVQISTAQARTGTRALLMASNTHLGMANLSNAATRVLGFGLYVDSLAGTSRAFAGVGDGGTLESAANGQIALALNATGHLEVRRGAALNAAPGGTLLATSVNALTGSTWQFVELVVTVDNTVGVVEVYVNGSKTGWIDFAGDTQNTANAYSNVIGLATVAGNAYYDDVYTVTGTGAAPTARLGDCKSVVKFAGTDVALGAGTYADSTPSSGTDRGAMVDEAQPDDDTTYTSFTAALQKDAYKTAALGQTGTIHAATIRARLKKADAGDGTAQIGVRSATTDDFGADVFPSDTSYQWFNRPYTLNPATGTAWTVAALDAAQILVKRTL